jgi:hypothetical protein
MFTFKKSKASARSQIQIKEVRDSVLVLPNNNYRTILETSSINFELKSEDEQDTLIDNFQNFLNSLPCPLQILIRVREVDIDRYLEEFSKNLSGETEKVYIEQIKNYCEFIQNLVSGNKILSRKFYIVIPYKQTDKSHDFSMIKEQILLNQDIVSKGLEKLGMKTRPLNNLELLELFYKFYNPDQIKSQELTSETFKALFNNTYAI